MFWLFFSLTGIVLLIALIWVTRITVHTEYKNYSGNNELQIQFRAWFGLIRYAITIPVLNVESNPPGLEAEGSKGINGEEDTGGRLSAEELVSMLEEIKEILDRIIGVQPIIKDFLAHVTVRKFEWKTAFGTGDAAITGVLAGAIWAIKGSVAGLASEYMKLKVKPDFMVTPYFQFKTAGTMLTCMFTFRAGKAISAGIKLFAHWKGKKTELLSKSLNVVPNEE
ncbi:hypothetical protein A8F94_05900 [Bacillus sp. FJAT-27225]|uniref:DUF2953 domain-containing protein n=1 Tax=Bacillus sp. FJAT-27225 TaxID=1743144 RepID=UPI00080C331A|nr:DUF2953 domain-containing protein [Bacillus sp. FJAT-27225]OCA91388.1 hypothetical protein A8F94_05900 [Bacillus sp. FJAT-27225]